MTATFSRRPAFSNAWILTLNIGMVVVRKAEKPTMCGSLTRTASTNFSGGQLTPRSTTSKPAPSSMMTTRFFPMSWMSPLTVPITTFPIGWAPVSAMSGRRMTSAPCIARAAMSISGTKKSPFSKRRPTSSRDGIRALNRMSIGSMPRDSPSSLRPLTSGACPLTLRSNRPARISSSRLIATPPVAHRPTDAQGPTRIPPIVLCCAVSNEPRDAAVIRSVDRAVAILDLLAREGWRSGAEVARELKVHRSTALRLLGTLERHALVERDPRTAKYRLGRRLPQLASVVTGELDLRSVARPVCEQLAGTVGETVTLDVLDADEIVPIEQATGSTSVVSVNWLGRRTPIHCTASGKVILAFAPNAVRQRLLGRPLERSTAHTITGRAELEGQLGDALKDGFARTYEELEVGLDATPPPVFAASGEVVAALDLSGPSHRLRTEGRPELVRLTLDAAADLSRRLGYRARETRV